MVRLPRFRKPASGLRPLRVLIVEDSENDALLLVRELRRGGYEPVHERVETAEAMEVALAGSRWEVVISDYRLPHFGALEALRVFRKSGADAPFIVVSGKVGEEAAVEVMKAGAYDFLTKGNLALDHVAEGNMPLLCLTVERGLEEARERRETKRTKEELSRRDAVLEAVRFAAERFLGKTHAWEENVRTVLRRLGEAAQVSRVYIFENYTGEDGNVWATQRYEWVAPGISVQIGNPLLKALPYRTAGFGRWEEVLGREELIYGHTHDFPPSEQPELQAEEILSIVVVPIFVEEGEWWGFVGFDECLSEREWFAAEMDALKAAASTLGAALRRRRAEGALRESEERYSLVVDGSNDGIFDWDIRTGELYWNHRLYEMLGLSRSAISPTFDLFVERLHPEDRQRVLDAIAAHLERGAKYSEEFRLQHSSGDYVYCIGRGMAQRDEHSVPVRMAGAVTDVTERKRAEEALRENEERYRAVIEQSAEGLYLIDGATKRILETNPALQNMLGYTADELCGMELQEVVAHAREDVEANVERTLKEGSRFIRERGYRRKDGSVVEVEIAASAINYAGKRVICAAVRDITERKKAEEALRQSERLYRTVIEQVTENICLVDIETTCIVGSNPAFRETLGYTAEELQQMTLYDIVAHDKESTQQNIRRTLEEGRAFVGQRKYRRKDGTLLEVEASGSVILRDGRKTICVVAHDVTARARMQELLEDRLATLSAIAARVTLDLSMEDMLGTLAEGVVKASTAVACLVASLDESTGVLRPLGAFGLPEGSISGLDASWRAGAQSPTIEAFRRQEPVLVPNTRAFLLGNELYGPIHPFVREATWDTAYIVPLVSRGRSLGALNILYSIGQEPGEEEKVFLKAVADQTAVAVENARLFAEARGKAVLEERQRLARELHDSVSQALYGIALGAKSARTLVKHDPDQAAAPLDYVLSLTEAGLAEMRALIFELRPESLEKEGLVAALKKQAVALRARNEIEVETNLCNEPDAPLEVKEALYRIAQEALHNTVKHAGANNVQVRMGCSPEHIELAVSDDGLGFNPEGDFPGHLGLHSMRERTERLGGTLAVDSAPGKGTKVRARIPI